MAVIDAVLVERWIQDPPATANCEAFITITADAACSVASQADAALAFGTDFEVSVPVIGDAEIAADMVLAISVALVGEAEVEITAPFRSDGVGLAAAIALVPIISTCDVAIPLDVSADIVIFDTSTVAPAVEGTATVAIQDYGQGSSPLFPFQLPMLFSDNPLGVQLAEASIAINGFSDDVRIAGFADAEIGFVGDTPMTLGGSLPIFDFTFPAIFAPPGNVYLAEATLAFTADADAAVSVLADASAAITSSAARIDPTVFSFVLPAQFIS
jgi:hypothetical protein